jgi:hypothetical protein
VFYFYNIFQVDMSLFICFCSGSENGSGASDDDAEEDSEDGSQLSGDFINDGAYTQHESQSEEDGPAMYLKCNRYNMLMHSPEDFVNGRPNIAALLRKPRRGGAGDLGRSIVEADASFSILADTPESARPRRRRPGRHAGGDVDEYDEDGDEEEDEDEYEYGEDCSDDEDGDVYDDGEIEEGANIKKLDDNGRTISKEETRKAIANAYKNYGTAAASKARPGGGRSSSSSSSRYSGGIAAVGRNDNSNYNNNKKVSLMTTLAGKHNLSNQRREQVSFGGDSSTDSDDEDADERKGDANNRHGMSGTGGNSGNSGNSRSSRSTEQAVSHPGIAAAAPRLLLAPAPNRGPSGPPLVISASAAAPAVGSSLGLGTGLPRVPLQRLDPNKMVPSVHISRDIASKSYSFAADAVGDAQKKQLQLKQQQDAPPGSIGTGTKSKYW